MKIKEGVIYNKNEEEFIGYTMLGEVNDSLLPNVSTPSIATYSSLLWILVCLKSCVIVLQAFQQKNYVV